MRSRNPLFDPDARIVIAHRGNRVAVAENTMEALVEARELGADALEFDIRVTRDGIPVVIHDEDVDRTTDARGRVDRFSFDELGQLDAGVRVPSSAGRQHRIPSLEQVLDRFRDTPLVIEVKTTAAADGTERLIRKFAAQERVVIGSSDARVMDRFYRSGLRTCASTSDAVLLIPIAIAGLTPRKPGYDILSVTPTVHGFPIPVAQMARAARRAGVPTHVWTVNDPAHARALWAGGVAGIITDDPAAILRARAA